MLPAYTILHLFVSCADIVLSCINKSDNHNNNSMYLHLHLQPGAGIVNSAHGVGPKHKRGPK